MIRHLPNALTLLNLFLGCCAIALLVAGAYHVVLVLTIVCLILDVGDGLLARRLKLASPLGVQLDSLADLVSFGVLPGMILYSLMLAAQAETPLPSWTAFLAFCIPAAVALRLARFNLDTRDRTVFYGLPTPSAAVYIFGLLWMSMEAHPLYQWLGHPAALYALVLLLPALMLSELQLWSLKGVGKRHGKVILAVFLGAFALLLIWQRAASVTLMIIGYVSFGIVNRWLKIYTSNEVQS